MIIPLILGSLVKTFFPSFLDMGSFVTALFKQSALPLIALLIFATGAQTTVRVAPKVLAKAGALLLAKTLVPGAIIAALGIYLLGRGEVLPGISVLSLLAALSNSNGGLWIALASQYGDATDVGAYIASALNDGPFFTMLFLGVAGLAQIPGLALLAAVLPYILGFILGNLDQKIGEIYKPTASIVIPFFAFALGAGIDIRSLGMGAIGGTIIGLLSTFLTGAFGFLSYKAFFKDANPGVGFAIGTTAGNSVVVPSIVAQVDPRYASLVASASAACATAVLITAILTPVVTHIVATRYRMQRNA